MSFSLSRRSVARRLPFCLPIPSRLRGNERPEACPDPGPISRRFRSRSCRRFPTRQCDDSGTDNAGGLALRVPVRRPVHLDSAGSDAMPHRHWFGFELQQVQVRLVSYGLGCGVTAYSYDDAVSLMKKLVFRARECRRSTHCDRVARRGCAVQDSPSTGMPMRSITRRA
jgi:hypothetical protein